jgi:hypothetical protein
LSLLRPPSLASLEEGPGREDKKNQAAAGDAAAMVRTLVRIWEKVADCL